MTTDNVHGTLVHTGTAALAPTSGGALALAERAKADTLARYQMALMRPRDWDQVRQDLLRECRCRGLAEAAEWRLPRRKWNPNTKKTETVILTGPTIRLAEAIARTVGNIDTESVVVAEDAETRTIRVSATDLERNTRFSGDVAIRKTQERRKIRDNQIALGTRVNSEGQKLYLVAVSEQELLQATQAQVSRLLRGHLLRLIPRDLLDEAIKVCLETRTAQDASDPHGARKRLADAFAALGVNPKDLAEYLGHELGQCSPAELEDLRLIYAGIRDGQTTWTEVIQTRHADTADETSTAPQQDKATKASELRERLKATRAAKIPEQLPQPHTGAAPNGIRWLEWVLMDTLWIGDWADPDADEIGKVEVDVRGRPTQAVSDGLGEAIAWAFSDENS